MQRMLDGFNDNLENQMKRLHAILKENKVIYDILRKASQLDLEDYYKVQDVSVKAFGTIKMETI